MFVIRQLKSVELDSKHPINNGNRTEWSPIRSVTVQVIFKDSHLNTETGFFVENIYFSYSLKARGS